MDETTKTHIFEPFFTTKEPGKGTGLGLSTVYGIVKQSGAHIWVYSEPGRGATIKMYFPLVHEKPDQVRETSEPTILGGTETILLVEDDQLLRNVTFQLLSAVGYKVLEAETPNQAIQMAQDNAEPIDLVLTDVIMPVMGGLELSTRLKALRPELKVIFTSGYTGNALARQMPVAGPFVLIEKPYSRASLLTTVYEVLRGHTDAYHVTPAPLD
jgi:CheY-like chemotaxis protein